MAKSLSDLRTQVRSYLDETTASDWTNAELNTLINAYYHKVYSAVIEVFEDYAPSSKSNITTVKDQEEYTLPTDLLKVRRIEINYDVSNANSVPMRALPINMDQVRRDLGNQNVGVNVLRNPVYYLRGTSIGFLPIPDKAGTNAITVWYIPVQTDLSSDTSTITLPYPDRDWLLIAWGAAAEALRFGQQESLEADKLDAKYDRGIEKMKELLEDRIAEEAKTVIDTQGDSVDFGAIY